MSNNNPRYVSGTVHNDVLAATLHVEQIRDPAVVQFVRDELLSLVNSTHARHVVIDLRNVRFIGSVGLLAFLALRRHLGDGRIVLCQLSEPLFKLFVSCRLIATADAQGGTFEVAATLESALAQFASS